MFYFMQLFVTLLLLLLSAHFSPAFADTFSTPPLPASGITRGISTPSFTASAPEPAQWCNIGVFHCADQVNCDMGQGQDRAVYGYGWRACSDYSWPWDASALLNGTPEQAAGGLLKGDLYYYSFDSRSTNATAYTAQYPKYKVGLREAMSDSSVLAGNSALQAFKDSSIAFLLVVIPLAVTLFAGFGLVLWLIRKFRRTASI